MCVHAGQVGRSLGEETRGVTLYTVELCPESAEGGEIGRDSGHKPMECTIDVVA